MKKILSLLIIAASLLTVVSCAKYDPVKSTKEEKRVVMTMSFGDEEYEVRYELYRALFLNRKSDVDGGDPSVWFGADKQKYIDEINGLIKSDASKIFAAFYICKVGTGFDVYSRKADKLVEQYVEESVEGSDETPGFGSYDAYLAHLKSVNLNYSVQDLIYRYYIALDKITEFYAGAEDDKTTKKDETVYPYFDAPIEKVRAFYFSNSFKRVLYAYFSEKTEKDPREVKEKMENAVKHGADAVKQVIGAHTATPGNDIDTGLFLSENAFNNVLHDKIFPSASVLADDEVSEVLTINGTGESSLDGKYILFSAKKSEEDFEIFYKQIKDAYISELMAELLNSHAYALSTSTEFKNDYSTLNHSEISM